MNREYTPENMSLDKKWEEYADDLAEHPGSYLDGAEDFQNKVLKLLEEGYPRIENCDAHVISNSIIKKLIKEVKELKP